ncbi:MAG TPA: hypothetical protein PLD30_11305 [Candidatus Competibacteraceae bacterium]|nr:hypothetical protein [Candidatus Competibacteraceae bacterium]
MAKTIPVAKCSLFLWILLLAACSALDGLDVDRRDRIPTGTPIDLHQNLTIPSGQAGVFVLGTSIGGRYRYEAVCRLEVYSIDEKPRTVVADRFTIVRFSQEWERFSQRETGLHHVSLQDYDGPALLRFTTNLYLHSDRQPDVFRLVCSHLQDSAQQPRYLTTAEIRTVLAPVMTLY